MSVSTTTTWKCDGCGTAISISSEDDQMSDGPTGWMHVSDQEVREAACSPDCGAKILGHIAGRIFSRLQANLDARPEKNATTSESTTVRVGLRLAKKET
jgi:DNA-directed RNA polymerase subunit RPC12/RpoP